MLKNHIIKVQSYAPNDRTAIKIDGVEIRAAGVLRICKTA
jgi:hypothetical protein